jgi:ribosomal protein S18 acetylase RimI-like enzyme
MNRPPSADVSIVEATPDDAALVHALTLAAYEEYRDTLTPPSGVFDDSVADVRREIADGGAIIAFWQDEPAGCARFEVAPDGSHLYVGRVAVVPDWRGRGIVAMMMDWCERHAAERGPPEVRLGARLGLPRNIALYTRLGYEIDGYEEDAGFGRIAAWMRKRVSPGISPTFIAEDIAR